MVGVVIMAWLISDIKSILEYITGKMSLFVVTHINGIESFWGYAKTRLAPFRGIHKIAFLLHLKECEFRFNNRDENLYLLILDILRKKPLF